MENKKAGLGRLERRHRRGTVCVFKDADNLPGQLYFDNDFAQAVTSEQIEEWNAKKMAVVIITYTKDYATP